MKYNTSLITGALLIAAAAGANAQTTATTDPVGYITCKVAAGNSLSFLSPTLVNKLEFSGVAASATATTVTLTGTPLTPPTYDAAVNPAFDAAVPMPGYYLEVSSGSGEGQWANITSTTNSVVTVDRNLSTFITGGTTTVRIRKHSTIGEVFGATNSAGLAGSDQSATADEIKLLKPVTHAVKSYYYFNDGAGFTQWADLDGNDAINVIIFPDQGIVLQRKTGAALSFVRVGHVKTGKTALYATPGINVMATPRAVGDGGAPANNFNLGNSNLANTGALSTHVKGSDQSATADVLRIPQASPNVLKEFYFFDDGAGFTQWADLDGIEATTELLNEGEAFILIRQAGAGALTWTAPAQIIAP